MCNTGTFIFICLLCVCCCSCGPKDIGSNEIATKNGKCYYQGELMEGEFTIIRHTGARHRGEYIFENGELIEWMEIDGQTIMAKGYSRELRNPNPGMFSKVSLDSCFEGSEPPAYYSFRFILRDSSFVNVAYDSLADYMMRLRQTEKFDTELLILDSVVTMGTLEPQL